MNAIDRPQNPDVSIYPRPSQSLAKRWILASGAAVVLVAFAYSLATVVADPLVVAGVGEVTLGNVIGFTILGGTVGALLAYLIGRFARKPRLTFIVLTLIAIAAYATVPFTAAESLETAIWLNVFHLVVAGPMVVILAGYLPAAGTKVDA